MCHAHQEQWLFFCKQFIINRWTRFCLRCGLSYPAHPRGGGGRWWGVGDDMEETTEGVTRDDGVITQCRCGRSRGPGTGAAVAEAEGLNTSAGSCSGNSGTAQGSWEPFWGLRSRLFVVARSGVRKPMSAIYLHFSFGNPAASLHFLSFPASFSNIHMTQRLLPVSAFKKNVCETNNEHE